VKAGKLVQALGIKACGISTHCSRGLRLRQTDGTYLVSTCAVACRQALQARSGTVAVPSRADCTRRQGGIIASACRCRAGVGRALISIVTYWACATATSATSAAPANLILRNADVVGVVHVAVNTTLANNCGYNSGFADTCILVVVCEEERG
jgi:hypothetical protein